MQKILVSLIVILTAALNSLGVFAQDGNPVHSINVSEVSKGIVHIGYFTKSDKKIKVLVEKGEKKYSYNLQKDGTVESFPLQMGNGEYRISILENIEGTRYRYAATETVNAEIKDEKALYLNSIQNVKWDDSMAPIKKAQEIADNLDSDEEKIKAIYEYVVKNYKYDHDKLNKLEYDYLPDIQSTFQSGTGICYDFASLYAAMLRSQGISAKLVKGYAENIKGYHAWNEVYVKSTGKWVIIDTTLDSQMTAAKISVDMEKKGDKYTKMNEY